MKFLLKYASRSRPALFKQRVDNWNKLASGKHELVWICSFDTDDPTMQTADIRDFCQANGIMPHYAPNKSKVQAINASMNFAPPEWDIVIIVSDDMACLMQDWDDIVAKDMEESFTECNGALWYPDGRQDRTCTLSIMGRPVYRRLGHLYHPAFRSVYCDNYFQHVMERSNQLKKINKPVFAHEWRKDNSDALMARNEHRAVYLRDKQTFDRLMRSR